MLLSILALTALAADLASAHYDLLYPSWRGDSYESPASQWTFPCANINTTSSTNRTSWPLDGGSLVLELHHPWTYMWINLGLGDEVAAFNVSLTPNVPFNQTGKGTLCLPRIEVPEMANVTEGATGSIQVITVGDNGAALYNCADVIFESNATLLSEGDMGCTNSSGVSIMRLEQKSEDSGSSEGDSEDGEDGASDGSESAGHMLRVIGVSSWGTSMVLCSLVAMIMLGFVSL